MFPVSRSSIRNVKGPGLLKISSKTSSSKIKSPDLESLLKPYRCVDGIRESMESGESSNFYKFLEDRQIIQVGYNGNSSASTRIDICEQKKPINKFEDKIERFSDKNKHQLFVEPEGWVTNEVYLFTAGQIVGFCFSVFVFLFLF
jgi:hypothetical protein